MVDLQLQLSAFADPRNALQVTPELEDLVDKAREVVADNRSPRTREAYELAWRTWSSWATKKGVESMPASPTAVALYLVDHEDHYSVSTLVQHLAAIAAVHQDAGLESPTRTPQVSSVIKGIRRRRGVAPKETKTPLRVAELREMVDALDLDKAIGLRNRALLLVGFAGAFRRSELVGLDAGDLERVYEGFVVRLRRSKADQEAEGRKIGLPLAGRPAYCPVRTLEAWLAFAEIEQGPIFRPIDRHGQVLEARLGARSVARIVKRAGQRIGLEPEKLGGHSLRAGFATEAARQGASERAIARQTGHKSLRVLRGYIREGSLFNDNAAAGLL